MPWLTLALSAHTDILISTISNRLITAPLIFIFMVFHDSIYLHGSFLYATCAKSKIHY